MGEETVRWTVVVDKATDVNLRGRLAERGLKDADLSKFVEDAVKRELLREAIDEFREGFADLDPADAQALLDEELAEVRQRPAK